MTPGKLHITLERGVWHLQRGRIRHSLYWSNRFREVCQVAAIIERDHPHNSKAGGK